MIQLWTFFLAIFGLTIHVLLTTAARDREDPRVLTPLDIIWSGAAKWKTIAQIMFVLAITIFFPPEFLEKSVGAEYAGVPVGKGGAVIFGYLSEEIMAKLFRIAKHRANKRMDVQNGGQ